MPPFNIELRRRIHPKAIIYPSFPRELVTGMEVHPPAPAQSSSLSCSINPQGGQWHFLHARMDIDMKSIG
jgi:hypothetical protein